MEEGLLIHHLPFITIEMMISPTRVLPRSVGTDALAVEVRIISMYHSSVGFHVRISIFDFEIACMLSL